MPGVMMITLMDVTLVTILTLSTISGSGGSRPASFPGAEFGPEGEFSSPAIRTGYTCEGEELMIKCEESDEDIQIIRANYGRFSIAICNDDGKTHWSVNCMSPKTRHILQKKCDSHNSCTVPVSSDLFGDPCPGTHKYVEIHYTCSPKTDTTRRPLPPWYLQQPSVHSNSEFWTQNAAPGPGRHSDLSVGAGANVGERSGYNSRIPILVATTTTTPRRIPITTPKPTTTTQATTTTTSPVTTESEAVSEDGAQTSKDAASELFGETNEVAINREPESYFAADGALVSASDPVFTTITDLEEDLEVSESELTDFCPPVSARNLYWKLTRGGQMMIQPCPNGATGLARWQCAASSRHEAANWASEQPDLSDCKSVPMSNLEVKVRQEDPENVLASSLARLTGSRQLYGGDLQSAVAVMRTVASRIQYLLQQREDKFYKKEAFIQEVLLNIVRAASNLLDAKNREAWSDLEVAAQMKVASSLLLTVEENAFLFAEVTNQQEILMESSYNILMAISVLNVKDIRNGSSFPSNNYEEPFGTIEDSIFLPAPALERNARDKLVKTVFFSFKHLDEILSRGEAVTSNSLYSPGGLPRQILNSRVISASLVRGKHLQLPQAAPVRVSLKHLREEGMGGPVCVFWSLDTSTWSGAGCRVVETNTSLTVCECDHLTNFAVLMEEQSVPIVIHLPAFHVEIIVGAVISVLLLITIIVLFKFREQVQKMLKIPCSKEEKKGLENCHKSQSFFNGINLMQAGPGGEKTQTLSTNMAGSQSRLSQYILSNGGVMAGEEAAAERYENIHGDRYEDIQGTESFITNQATLPMRSHMSPHSAHITLNPYSTQLVDNLNRMMVSGPGGHIYQVASISPAQLTNLTNTLKKKKCVGGHSGPCQHSRINTPLQSDSSCRSDSLTPLGQDTDTELLPVTSAATEVVFRAVSPHGHVYWEIDPKRVRGQHGPASDEDTQTDLHNMSDFSEDDGSKVTSGSAASDRSRQSSRFSDHRPLLASSSPCHMMQPLPEAVLPPVISFSPSHRFSSLQKGPSQPGPQAQFSTRTRLGRTQPRQRQEAEPQQYHIGQTEQLQQQVQIPDLRRLPVQVKSSEYIMAKIQSHMDRRGTRGPAPSRQEREV